MRIALVTTPIETQRKTTPPVSLFCNSYGPPSYAILWLCLNHSNSFNLGLIDQTSKNMLKPIVWKKNKLVIFRHIFSHFGKVLLCPFKFWILPKCTPPTPPPTFESWKPTVAACHFNENQSQYLSCQNENCLLPSLPPSLLSPGYD